MPGEVVVEVVCAGGEQRGPSLARVNGLENKRGKALQVRHRQRWGSGCTELRGRTLRSASERLRMRVTQGSCEKDGTREAKRKTEE